MPEDPSFYLRHGASARRATILSESYKAWNNALYYYVCQKRICPANAVNRVRAESVEELKLTLELISYLPGSALGAIKLYKPIYKKGITLDEVVQHVAEEAETHYDKVKTFIDRWSAIHTTKEIKGGRMVKRCGD